MLPKTRIQYATVAVMLLGGILAFVQFLCDRSLWLDEAMLSLNIINRNYTQLLKPLDYTQVAPIGFLFIEKYFSVLIPNSAYGLRILPLVCFWLAVYLFYKVVSALQKDTKITFLAVSLFCLNPSLLYYSSEVKQYMLDVFVCLWLYYSFLKPYKKESSRYLCLAFAGVISIFLSNVSVIILLAISILFIIKQKRQGNINYFHLAIPFMSWGLFFGVYYFVFIHHHPNKAGMLAYWGNSFLPINIFERGFFDFCFYKTKMVFGSLLAFGIVGLLPFLFFMIGLVKLIKTKQKQFLLLLLLPALIQLLLSACKLYPFDLRLILYQTGFYILIISIGFMYSVDIAVQKTGKSWIVYFAIVFALIPCIDLFKNYPAKTEEIKESIQFIANNIKPNETIYVYYGATMAFNYYLQTGKIDFKNKIIFGNAYRGNNQKYVEEIKQNKQKCWILFSHIYDDENKYIVSSLDSIYKKEFSYKAYGSEAYIYDITN